MMNSATFKELMAGVPAPVSIVTTSHRNAPRGATVSAFASLSLDPALVSIALSQRSSLLESLRENGRFAINLLAHDQAELALRFAASIEDRFSGVEWHFEHDLPRLKGVARYIECKIENDMDGGDHVLIFGRVVDCWMSEIPSLIYVSRQFATTTMISMGAGNDVQRTFDGHIRA